VKGFAVTLTMGIIASLFTALVVTRNLFEWSLKTGILKKITMSSLIKATNFDFLGKRKAAITLSLLFHRRVDRDFRHARRAELRRRFPRRRSARHGSHAGDEAQ
jgi:hypothetical protein